MRHRSRRHLVPALRCVPLPLRAGLLDVPAAGRSSSAEGRRVLFRRGPHDGHLGNVVSAIAPKYGAGPTTAAIGGLAWWAIKSLQSAKWVGLGFVPQGVVLVPLATTLIAILVA